RDALGAVAGRRRRRRPGAARGSRWGGRRAGAAGGSRWGGAAGGHVLTPALGGSGHHKPLDETLAGWTRAIVTSRLRKTRIWTPVHHSQSSWSLTSSAKTK